MRPPPSKPFAVAFLASLGVFIVWGVVGAALEPYLSDPSRQAAIGRVVLPVAFALFLVMGFSAVPVMVGIFFSLFARIQEAAGNAGHPAVRWILERRETIAGAVVYGTWILYALGTLIGAPFFF